MLNNSFRTKHGASNYKAIKPFLEAVDNGKGYRHFKSEGFMDLVIENLQRTEYFLGEEMTVYSIGHYAVEYGDIMADPDMEIGIVKDEDTYRVIPMTFRNDYLPTYQYVFMETDEGWRYSTKLLKDLDDFLYIWLRNIKMQGFYDDIKSLRMQD